jgi:hypothetical protein
MACSTSSSVPSSERAITKIWRSPKPDWQSSEELWVEYLACSGTDFVGRRGLAQDSNRCQRRKRAFPSASLAPRRRINPCDRVGLSTAPPSARRKSGQLRAAATIRHRPNDSLRGVSTERVMTRMGAKQRRRAGRGMSGFETGNGRSGHNHLRTPLQTVRANVGYLGGNSWALGTSAA